MLVIDCRLPVPPGIPVVVSPGSGAKISSSPKETSARSSQPGERRRVNVLGVLTLADRELIHAVTGEVFWTGQVISGAPISGFALQIAADRRMGLLPDTVAVSVAYLAERAEDLHRLGVAPNPFPPELIARANGYLDAKTQNRIDLAL